MKKIIYSLVIMIAASSLFTSCIQPVEPVGIQELRIAKADYLAALSQLRLADAELVKAQATYQLAQAALVDAQTENQKIMNERAELENEMMEAQNEEEIANIQARLADLQREQEINQIEHEKALAQAEEDLRVALAAIKAAGLKLTDAEAAAVAQAIAKYEGALENFNMASETVSKAEAFLWNIEYNMKTTDYAGMYKYYVDFYATAVENYTKTVAQLKQMQKEGVTYDEMADEWGAQLKAYQDSIKALEYSRLAVTSDSVTYMVGTACDGYKAFVEELNDWIKDNKPAAKEWKNWYVPGKNFVSFPLNDLSGRFIHYAQWLGYDSVMQIKSAEARLTDQYKVRFGVQKEGDYKNAASEAEVKWMLYGKEDDTVDQGLNGILSALQRHLVVVNEDDTDAKNAKKYAEFYDKAFEKCYEILKAGKDAFVKDEKALVDSLTKKEIAASNNYYKVAEDLVVAISDYYQGLNEDGIASKADSTSIINAIKAFAQTKEEFLDTCYRHHQDSLIYVQGSAMMGQEVKRVHLSDIERSGFAQQVACKLGYMWSSSTPVADEYYYVRSLYGSIYWHPAAHATAPYSDYETNYNQKHAACDFSTASSYIPSYDNHFVMWDPIYKVLEVLYNGTYPEYYEKMFATAASKFTSTTLTTSDVEVVTNDMGSLTAPSMLAEVNKLRLGTYNPYNVWYPSNGYNFQFVTDSDGNHILICPAVGSGAGYQVKSAALMAAEDALAEKSMMYNDIEYQFWGDPDDDDPLGYDINWDLATFENLIEFDFEAVPENMLHNVIIDEIDDVLSDINKDFFLFMENYVKGKYNYRHTDEAQELTKWHIIPNSELAIVLYELEKMYNYSGSGTTTSARVLGAGFDIDYAIYESVILGAKFPSLLVKKIFADQWYEWKYNAKANEEALKEITAIIEEQNTKYANAVASKTDYNNSVKAYNKALTGKESPKDSDIVNTEMSLEEFIAEYVKGGKFTFAGMQKEIADKHIAELPEKVKWYADRTEDINHYIGHYKTLIETFDKAYTAAWNVVNSKDAPNFDAIVAAAKAEVESKLQAAKTLLNQSKTCLAEYEEMLAQYEAGYDDVQLALAHAKNQLTEAQAALADAAAQLKIAEAELNAVLAAYVK